jgi:polysaccharide biosynthesis transport protein
MEDDSKDVREYFDVLRRRKGLIALTALLLFAVAAAVAILLPPVYRSTATILIEQQEIPADLVRSTISGFADQRIQVISQQVMTRSNLMRIVEKYDLYPALRRTKTTEEVLERLSRDIKLDLLKADVIDQRSGAKTTATIAFSLSYSGEAPAVAQRVANELVTLFLGENLKTREQKTAETSTFLADEASKLGKHVAEIEARLAEFKARNIGRLPELVQLNLTLRDRTDNEIREVDRQISALEERKFYVEGQLAQVKPNTPLFSAGGERILDPTERLKSLQALYASASGVYSPQHPDIMKMRREIEALKKETGSLGDPEEQAKQLVKLRTELAAVREKYSPDHPDVAKLTKSIAALDAEQRGAPPARSAPAIKPENPAYIALQSQLDANSGELKSLRHKRKELEGKVATYERRLEQTPQVEREYLDLTRDHESSLARYREIKTKQMQAQIGQELEKERKGERFSLIDPPQLPEQPASPNRPAILLLGAILAVGGGLGSAAVRESMDDSIRGSRSLARLAGVPVLAVIPFVETDRDRLRKRRLAIRAFAGTFAALGIILLVLHTAWMPLDVLMYRALRGFQNYAPGIASTNDVERATRG